MNLNDVKKRIKCDATPQAERIWALHIRRIERMAADVENRFPDVRHANQIRLKHCQWLQERFPPGTARDYRSSLRLLIEALGKDDEWFRGLRMSASSAGGRPRSVSVVRSRSSKFWTV
jgi:hypothetical protein